MLDFLGRGRIDHVDLALANTWSPQSLGHIGASRFLSLCTVHRSTGTPCQTAASAIYAAPVTVDDQELRPAQAALDEIVEDRAGGLDASAPMLLIASNTFWPSARTPITTSGEIAVAFRSSRTPTTVPSR